MKLGTIYYVGEFPFPDGSAASFRVLGNARTLQAAGYKVHVFGRGENKSGNVHGIAYHLADDYGNKTLHKGQKIIHYIFKGGCSLRKWILSKKGEKPLAIFLMGGYSRYFFRIQPIARLWNIPLIIDMADWIEPSHCWGGRFGPQRWDVELTLRQLIRKAGYALSVSTYLEKYFQSRKIKTFRIPPLVDTREEKWRVHPSLETTTRLRMVFVGNAGKKDLVINAVRGIATIPRLAERCELVFVGPSLCEIKKRLGRDSYLIEKLGKSLQFTGALAHIDALRVLASADFSILLRPNLRFAQAGFPTKLVESLAMGIPLLGNITSDISMYVRDGDEGIIVKDESPAAFVEGVERAIALSSEQRKMMKEKARARAESSFDYRHWVEPFRDYMNSVVKERQA